MDLMKMFSKMKDVQAKVQEAQENLVHIRASAESGAGMVKATVNGHKQLVSLTVDDDLMKVEDKEMMQDLIVAAVNKALDEVDGLAKEEMRKSTEGMLPNIPGMNFGM